MSELDRNEARKDINKYSYSKYENLNNNQLKFTKKIPSDLNNKYRDISLEKEKRSERTYDNKEEVSYDYSYKNKRRNSHSSNHHRRQELSRSRSRSKSRTISRKDNTSKYRNSEYKDDVKKNHHHHHHHRKHKHSKRHHKHHSSRTKSKDRYREEREESMRRHLLKVNSLNAYLQGKSSHIFYDENYLPLSSNPYKYLGKPGLEDNSTYLDNNEIPISTSDIRKKEVELYVMNLPNDLDIDHIKELLNAALISIGANEKYGNPIINVTHDKSGKYFILEFRTPNECKNAMELNEMKIMSRTLKIGQPKYLNEKDGNNFVNYNENSYSHDLFPILSSFGKEFDSKKGIDNRFNSVLLNYQNKVNNLISGQNSLYNTSSMGYNNLNLLEYQNLYGNQESNKPEPGTKLHVINLPESFDENNIIQLFKKFGKIKKIELINDEETDKFNGQCYLEYEEEKSYQNAIKYGTGLKLGDNFLLINKINVKEDNKVNNNKIKNINAENYKSTSSLGILASSINIGTKSKIS